MKKKINNDNPGVKILPLIIFIGFGLFGGLINYLKPLTITGPSWLVYLGVLILIGSFLGFGYMINFYKKNETEIEPTKTTFKIITSGLYRHSRNPVHNIMFRAGWFRVYFHDLLGHFYIHPCTNSHKLYCR